MASAFIVGVISDTHGVLHPQALAALAGSQLIIHAGDLGSPDILPALRRIAPVTAVRGNIDTRPWAAKIPGAAAVEAGSHWLYVLHDLKHLDLDPRAAGFAAVISGHTHVPLQEMRDGVLFLNPGSAGPRRFRLPVSLARLKIGRELQAELMVLGRL